MRKIHIPVMVKEVIEYIKPEDSKIYVDCTFGGGGYTEAILQTSKCHVLGIDIDPSTRLFGESIKARFGSRFEYINDNFINIKNILYGRKVDGLILDLGLSSMQLDEPERGFSFMRDGVLDMRMSQRGVDACSVVNSYHEDELSNIIYRYGEEGRARIIARAIVMNRPIHSTVKLAEIIRENIKAKKGKIDLATKTFQAIRIFVNREIENLEKFLICSHEILNIGGKLIVVSFHSLEDSAVKRYLKNYTVKKIVKSKYSKEEVKRSGVYELLTKKIVVPTIEEIKQNPRSRSARLRAAIKVESC